MRGAPPPASPKREAPPDNLLKSTGLIWIFMNIGGEASPLNDVLKAFYRMPIRAYDGRMSRARSSPRIPFRSVGSSRQPTTARPPPRDLCIKVAYSLVNHDFMFSPLLLRRRAHAPRAARARSSSLARRHRCGVAKWRHRPHVAGLAASPSAVCGAVAAPPRAHQKAAGRRHGQVWHRAHTR